MSLRLSIIRLIAATLILWGLGASALHAHEAHDEVESTPCDICLIMTAGDEQGAAIALPASAFSIYIATDGDQSFTRFKQSEIVITPVRGPPKRGPPSLF